MVLYVLPQMPGGEFAPAQGKVALEMAVDQADDHVRKEAEGEDPGEGKMPVTGKREIIARRDGASPENVADYTRAYRNSRHIAPSRGGDAR